MLTAEGPRQLPLGGERRGPGEAEVDPAVDAGLPAVAGGALLRVGDGAHHRVLGLVRRPGAETTRGWENDPMSPQGLLPMSLPSVE